MFAKKVKSYAKINLSLNVKGVQNGYHLIDSVVASVDIYDTVCVKPRSDKLINVYMHGLDSENISPECNNAVKAGEAFVSAFSTKGADIEIYKDIPIGAGLGGSSADAAGVLNALAKLYKIEDKKALKSLADTLGSDTGYMLSGGFARLAGRGERVFPLPVKDRYHFLLILPKSNVSSPECYRKYDEAPDNSGRYDSEICATGLVKRDFNVLCRGVYNALGTPSAKLNRDVAQALKEAASLSPSAYAVTGSGSAVFALFESEELCCWAKSRYRGNFRTRVVHTVNTAKVNSARSPFILSDEEIGSCED